MKTTTKNVNETYRAFADRLGVSTSTAYRICNPMQRVKHNANTRKWALANPEKVAESKRKWAFANPEKVAESKRKWVLANPEKVAENYRKWVLANPEKVAEYQKTARLLKETPDGLINNRFMVMKARAKKHGMGFNITKAYLKTLLATSDMKCSLSGVDLTMKIGESDVVSFDRIVNTQGYVYGNIQVVSAYGNTAKLDKSMEDFKSWVARADAHLNG